MKKKFLFGLVVVATTVTLGSYKVVLAKDSLVKGNNQIEMVYTLNSNPVEEFKVNSAKFKNSKELEIVFSQKIDKDYILYKDGRLIGQNMSITLKDGKGKENVKGKLSEDGKTIVITKIDGSDFDGEYVITLSKDIKSATGNPMGEFTMNLSVKKEANMKEPAETDNKNQNNKENKNVKEEVKNEKVNMIKEPRITHGSEKNKNIFVARFKKEVADESLTKENFKVMTKMGKELPITLKKEGNTVIITVEKSLVEPDKNGLIKISNVKSIDNEMFKERLQEVELIGNNNSLSTKTEDEKTDEKVEPIEEIRLEKENSKEDRIKNKDNKKETINLEENKEDKEDKKETINIEENKEDKDEKKETINIEENKEDKENKKTINIEEKKENDKDKTETINIEEKVDEDKTKEHEKETLNKNDELKNKKERPNAKEINSNLKMK
ncbi:Ig-like domain-containing domain [Clostridium senegalense]